MTNRDGSDEIYVMKAGGTEQPNLTNDLVNKAPSLSCFF